MPLAGIHSGLPVCKCAVYLVSSRLIVYGVAIAQSLIHWYLVYEVYVLRNLVRAISVVSAVGLWCAAVPRFNVTSTST
jgi:hypothetical protein